MEFAFLQVVIPGLVPGLCGGARRSDEAVVEHDAARGVFVVHGLEDGEGVGILEVGAELVLQAVLDDGGVRAEGFHHLDALDEHIALRELVGFGLGFSHDDAVGAGVPVRGGSLPMAILPAPGSM